MGTNKFIILAALPFVLAGAAFFGARSVDFDELVFSPAQLRALHFAPETIEVRVANGDTKAEADSGGRAPAGFFKPGSGRGAVLTGGAPLRQSGDPLAMKVSFIMLGSGGNLAIVNDKLVIEGDTVGGLTVKKIEEDKVLLKGKETRWVYMEGLR